MEQETCRKNKGAVTEIGEAWPANKTESQCLSFATKEIERVACWCDANPLSAFRKRRERAAHWWDASPTFAFCKRRAREVERERAASWWDASPTSTFCKRGGRKTAASQWGASHKPCLSQENWRESAIIFFCNVQTRPYSLYTYPVPK